MEILDRGNYAAKMRLNVCRDRRSKRPIPAGENQFLRLLWRNLLAGRRDEIILAPFDRADVCVALPEFRGKFLVLLDLRGERGNPLAEGF